MQAMENRSSSLLPHLLPEFQVGDLDASGHSCTHPSLSLPPPARSDSSLPLPPTIALQEVVSHNILEPRVTASHIEGENVEQSIGSSPSKLFVPMVSDSLRPTTLGMKFQTIEEAYNFYNLYARQAGFSVRKNNDKKNVKGLITHKNFVCSREGHTNNSRSESGVPMKWIVAETRVDCKACMCLRRSEAGSYYVRAFVEEHRHPLATPSKTHLFRSHRKVTKIRKKLIDNFEVSNIRPSQQMTIFEEQSHGYGNIGFTDTDLNNYTRDKREETKGLDAQMLYQYFQDKGEQNPSFLYTIRKDDAERITHVFWADGVCRSNYSRFGIVVSFDTAYKTNRYEMIFAPFTGVNHHGRSVVLGCGFLRNEKAGDFIWLFEEWQKAMASDPPKCFITDQDLSMTKAIAQVFPLATHSYCIWHIMDKGQKYLGSTVFTPKFSRDFSSIVYSAETPEEFESTWATFI